MLRAGKQGGRTDGGGNKSAAERIRHSAVDTRPRRDSGQSVDTPWFTQSLSTRDLRLLAVDDRPLRQCLRLEDIAEDDLGSASIAELGLCVRSLNCIGSNRVGTVLELLQVSPSRLMEIPNFGIGCLADVVERVRTTLEERISESSAADKERMDNPSSPQVTHNLSLQLVRLLAVDERPLREFLHIERLPEDYLGSASVGELGLSIRSFNWLTRNGVWTVRDLLQTSPSRLMQIRNFGIGCLADVVERIRTTLDEGISKPGIANNLSPIADADSDRLAECLPVDSLAYQLGYTPAHLWLADKIPLETLDLTVRAYNCVAKRHIRTVGELARRSEEALMAIRNMGRKSLADVRQRLAMLHFGVGTTPQEYRADDTTGVETTSIPTPFEIDLDQPYPSLTEWLSAVCKRSDKQQQAFLLRHGMHGRPPAKLQQIGDSLGVGRARAQQLASKAETRARKPHFVKQLRPLIDRAAEIIRLSGGMLSKEELVRRLLAVGPGGEMLAHATPFVEFLASSPDWCDAGLHPGSICTNEARAFAKRLSSVLVQIAEDAADERLEPGLWSVSIDALRTAALRWARGDRATDPIESISEAVIDHALQHVSTPVKRKGDRIYSADLWRLRFGKRVALVETIIRNSRQAMHYSEVYEQAKRLRPQDATITERNVASWLDRSDALLLWDRGTFIHKAVISVPPSLLDTIESWIEKKLAQGVPLYSVSGAFREFEAKCRESGLRSETALYTCLREMRRPRLNYPRYPYVVLPGADRIPVAVAIEQYIDEADGAATYDELRDFALEELGLKEFQLEQALSKLPNVITAEEGRFLHLDDFRLDRSLFDQILAHVRICLATVGHVSAARIYSDRVVTCKRLGIDGPRMLYSVLQNFAESEFGLPRYPQIRHLSRQQTRTRTGVIEYVVAYLAERDGPCSLQELEDHFVEELGYDARTVYAVVDRDGVLRYGPGCVMHTSAIGWDAQKQEQLELAACNAYERARRTGRCYALVSDFVESHWCDLPTLDHDIPWTETLVACLLARGGHFRILGNARNAFVPVPNNDGIETFEGLLGSILASDYGGAADKRLLEADLQKLRIIRRSLSPMKLDDGKRVRIVGNTVLLSELHSDA